MNPCLCILFAFAAAIAGQAPPPDFSRLERRMQELFEQARYEELAREGETAFAHPGLLPWQRRVLVFYAVRGLQGVADASGRPEGLCRARALLQRVERELGLEDDAAIAARLREQIDHRLRDQGPKDPCTTSRPRPAAASRPAQLMPVKVGVSATNPPERPTEPDSALVDIPRRNLSYPPRPPRRADPPPPPPAPPLDPPPPVTPPQRNLARTVGGSILIAAGAGFAAGMTAALVRRSDANAAIIASDKQIKAEQREETPEEVADVLRHDRIYRRMTAVAGVTGGAALITTIAGVALLASPRKQPRTTASFSATPWSAALTLAGKF